MTDYRQYILDRVPQFDERSRGFAAIAPDDTRNFRSYTWSCGIHLDQGREGACFPAGTLVRMYDGSEKPIEDVRTTDFVLTAEGNRGMVLQTMVRTDNQLVNVKLWGHNVFQSTPEHPILTKRGYIPAQDITTSDYVCLPKFSPQSIYNINIPDYSKQTRGIIEGTINSGGIPTEVTRVPTSVTLDYDFGRVVGLYAAEGHTTANKVVWSFGGHEKDTLVPELVGLIKTTVGGVAKTQVRPNGSVNVILYGKTWRLFFADLVPGTSKHGDKHLSNKLTSGNSNFLRGVFDGWMDGDGHTRRNERLGVSVSKRLAFNMYDIAQALDMNPTINVSNPSINQYAETRQQRWAVTVAFGNGSKPEHQDNAVWRKVVSTETIKSTQYVYNLHIQGDNSYVANGIGVHNCVGFGITHELAARPKIVLRDAAFALQLYGRARQLDEWPGEDYSGTSVLAGLKAAHELLNSRGRALINEYRWAFGIQDVLRVIGYSGPVVLGINWYEGMYDPDEHGFIKADGPIAGGHCILAKGVKIVRIDDSLPATWENLDKERSYVRLHNSWGEGYGIGGDAYISVNDLDKLLTDQGEAAIITSRSFDR